MLTPGNPSPFAHSRAEEQRIRRMPLERIERDVRRAAVRTIRFNRREGLWCALAINVVLWGAIAWWLA